MNGWMWTAGLTGLALMGAVVAPRMMDGGGTPPAPAPGPVEAVASPSTASGPTKLLAALDRDAVLRDRVEERFVTVTIEPPKSEGTPTRRPVDLAVVLDVSGSMAEAGKMVQARRSAHHLVDQLGDQDTFSLVTFSDAARVVIPVSAVTDRARLHRAIDAVSDGGGTNLHDGLRLGFSGAQHPRDGAISRVILLSDGHANVGVTDPGVLRALATMGQADGTTLSTVGLGLDYNEDLMASLADSGGGAYAFVGDAADLHTVFDAELQRAGTVVARQATVTLTLAEGVEGVEVIGWDATPVAGGWTIGVGDLHAGESRKIVARLSVRGHVGDSMDVVRASLAYVDVVADKPADATAIARVAVTDDAAAAEVAVNLPATIAAGHAVGNQLLESSTRAYATGDVATAQARLGKATEYLRAMGYVAGDDAAFDEEIADFEAQSVTYGRAAPSSSEGKAAIKGGKEKYRDRAR